MDYHQLLGLVAGGLTSASTFPQLIKTWRTKDAGDVSIKMFSILVTGVFLWLVYGILKSDLPLIAANAVAVVLNSIMLFFKVRYGSKYSAQ